MPFNRQGEVSPRFAEQFFVADLTRITTQKLLEQDVLAIQRPGARPVVVGHAAGLSKDPSVGGDIDAISQLLAKQGGGIVTTGSLRRHLQPPSPMPNIGFTDGRTDNAGRTRVDRVFLGQTGAANHFAVPSPELNRSYLEHLGRLQSLIEDRRQLLIVSLLGTPRHGVETDLSEYLVDWRDLLESMGEAGIHAVELNFSNPHIPPSSGDPLEGQQYRIPEIAEKVLNVCREAASEDMKIGIKLRHVGCLKDPDQLDTELVERLIARLGRRVDFITAVNTDPQVPIDAQRNPYFGKDRPKAGISGMPLHSKALTMVELLSRIRVQEEYSYRLFATGGARDPQSIQDFVNAGADAVLSTTGLYADPEMFRKYAES